MSRFFFVFFLMCCLCAVICVVLSANCDVLCHCFLKYVCSNEYAFVSSCICVGIMVLYMCSEIGIRVLILAIVHV